jgi:hypothetical protein
MPEFQWGDTIQSPTLRAPLDVASAGARLSPQHSLAMGALDKNRAALGTRCADDKKEVPCSQGFLPF